MLRERVCSVMRPCAEPHDILAFSKAPLNPDGDTRHPCVSPIVLMPRELRVVTIERIFSFVVEVSKASRCQTPPWHMAPRAFPAIVLTFPNSDSIAETYGNLLLTKQNRPTMPRSLSQQALTTSSSCTGRGNCTRGGWARAAVWGSTCRRVETLRCVIELEL